MKKVVDMLLVAAMLMSSIPGLAEDALQDAPPSQTAAGQPPELPEGMPDGQGKKPDVFDAVAGSPSPSAAR